jgi:hypothetical protein
MIPANTDASERICSCGELHKGHICYLTNMGMLQEVYHLSNAPTVSCEKCGARANLPHNLCFPAPPVQGDPGNNSDPAVKDQ